MIKKDHKVNEKQWKEDCLRYWGKILTGKYTHWCLDWDLLPIDDTCKAEFDCCTCDKEK